MANIGKHVWDAASFAATADVSDSISYRKPWCFCPPPGRKIRRFKEQVTRLATALIRLAYDASDERACQIQKTIITSLDLWSRPHDGQRALP